MPTNPFPRTSRYYNLDVATFELEPGREVTYLRRRFLPDSSNIILLAEHNVMQGERLDTITARYLGDPTLFWRVCDANTVLQPEELTETVGRVLRIPLPQGG